MLSEEELRRLIESLSIREIVEPALDNWTAYESTGKTIINLKTGKVQGIGLNINELLDMSHDNEHIELYKIESDNKTHKTDKNALNEWIFYNIFYDTSEPCFFTDRGENG